MPATDAIRYIRWFLSHVGEVLPLLDLSDLPRKAHTLCEPPLDR